MTAFPHRVKKKRNLKWRGACHLDKEVATDRDIWACNWARRRRPGGSPVRRRSGTVPRCSGRWRTGRCRSDRRSPGTATRPSRRCSRCRDRTGTGPGCTEIAPKPHSMRENRRQGEDPRNRIRPLTNHCRRRSGKDPIKRWPNWTRQSLNLVFH